MLCDQLNTYMLAQYPFLWRIDIFSTCKYVPKQE